MVVMTLTQLATNGGKYAANGPTIDDGIVYAKELLGEHKPYSVRRDIEGGNIILFNTHFISCMRQALTDGCVARMGKQELKFWLDFVKYQNDLKDGTLVAGTFPEPLSVHNAALEEVSRWISDELAGIPHPETKECYVPYNEG